MTPIYQTSKDDQMTAHVGHITNTKHKRNTKHN